MGNMNNNNMVSVCSSPKVNDGSRGEIVEKLDALIYNLNQTEILVDSSINIVSNGNVFVTNSCVKDEVKKEFTISNELDKVSERLNSLNSDLSRLKELLNAKLNGIAL